MTEASPAPKKKASAVGAGLLAASAAKGLVQRLQKKSLALPASQGTDTAGTEGLEALVEEDANHNHGHEGRSGDPRKEPPCYGW